MTGEADLGPDRPEKRGGVAGLDERPADWREGSTATVAGPLPVAMPGLVPPDQPSVAGVAGPRAVRRVAVRALTLTDFRNYRRAALAVDDRTVVLVGPNGAGKTNLLEAVSLLSPGRGLRRATYEEIARADGAGGWTVSARLATRDDGAAASGVATTMLGVGIDPPAAGGGGGPRRQRRIRIDGEDARAADDLLDCARILWLTPAMDGLFTGPAADRRRFLDRSTLAIAPGHGRRATLYEIAVRHRNRLFEERHPNTAWLDGLETEIAEHGAEVVRARAALVARLNEAAALRDADAVDFPRARLALEGDLERAGTLDGTLAERFRELLARNRRAEHAAGRTLIGPHRSDLSVVHVDKEMPAAKASTGEQKALLLGIVLGHAAIVAAAAGKSPILLLDEVAAHLDPSRRAALYRRLDGLDAQCFMTGTDPELFAALAGRAQIVRVEAGSLGGAAA